MKITPHAIPAVLSIGLLCALGCQSNQRKSIEADAFFDERPGVAEVPMGPADQPPPHDPPGVEMPAPDQPSVYQPEPEDMEESPRPDRPSPPANGASRVDPAPLPLPIGQDITVGGVVAEVNGIPVFADRVLAAVQGPLMTQAHGLNEQDFRELALELIRQETDNLIIQELHYAAAKRMLEPKDRALARALAVRWRQQQIYEAEGSVELARRRALAAGSTLHEQTEDRYREYMIELFRQRRIEPRVHVTANDMREYYDRHLATRFTDPDQIRFRVIRIDPRLMESRTDAQQRAEGLRARIEAGESFAELAGIYNHDRLLLRRQGDVGWMQRGDYAIENVEQAAWALEPGQTSEMIEADGAFFLVHVEERQYGPVHPFDDDQVQNRIHLAVRNQRVQEQATQMHRELLRDAVVRSPDDDPAMLQIAMDMAMQNYRLWSHAAAATKAGIRFDE